MRCKMQRTAKHNQFITLRAEGVSFDKIATQLKVGKQTLIQWSKYFEDDIKALQFEAFIQIKEAYKHSQKARYETLLKQLQKLDEAILSADVASASIKDLFTIKTNLEYQIEKMEKTLKADTNITQTDEYGFKEKLYLNLNEI